MEESAGGGGAVSVAVSNPSVLSPSVLGNEKSKQAGGGADEEKVFPLARSLSADSVFKVERAFDECGVCMTPMGVNSKIRLEYGHMLCGECVDNVFAGKRKALCPFAAQSAVRPNN